MENNEIFEAEAEVEVLDRSRSRGQQQQPTSSKTPDAFVAALGEAQGEREPLLGQTSRRVSGQSDGEAHPSPGQSFAHLPWYRTPSVWWLLPCYALFTTAFGATIVLKINVILSLICRNYFCERAINDPTFHMLPVIEGQDNPQCQIPEVQAAVSRFTLYISLISGILSAITSPKIGRWSDQYGRCRMIAFSVFAMMLSETSFILVAQNPDYLSVNWLLLGAFFDGLGGSFIATMAIAYAYASDCTEQGKRNVVFGWYQGCLFGGIAIGPILGGYIVKATGNMLSVFYFALGAHFAFFCFLLFVVPESLSKDRQLSARKNQEAGYVADLVASQISYEGFAAIKRILIESNLFAPLAILWPTERGTNPALRRNLVFLAAVDTTMFGIAMGSLTVILIYSEYMFGWRNFETNVFLTVVNTCRVTVLLVVLPLITRILRGPSSKRTDQSSSGCDNIDLGIIRFAIVFDILGYVGYSTAKTGNMFIASGALASLGGMASPTMQSAITKHVPPDRTGQILGALGLLHATARVLSPLVFNLIYAATVGKFSQTVFVCLGSMFALAFGFAWCVRPHVHWEDKDEDLTRNDDNESSNA